MPLLYYWRPDNYRRDLDWGAGFHLNRASARLHDVDLGDSLWAFTRARDGRYALAAELLVRAKTRNPAGFRYGGYRLWGDRGRSRYELADLSRFRNRLAHDGGLIDERENTLAEQQRLADAEGWLLTCCYRILAAILGRDVPLRDFAARGLPRRRPSERGFARSTFVPEETA